MRFLRGVIKTLCTVMFIIIFLHKNFENVDPLTAIDYPSSCDRKFSRLLPECNMIENIPYLCQNELIFSDVQCLLSTDKMRSLFFKTNIELGDV